MTSGLTVMVCLKKHTQKLKNCFLLSTITLNLLGIRTQNLTSLAEAKTGIDLGVEIEQHLECSKQD